MKNKIVFLTIIIVLVFLLLGVVWQNLKLQKQMVQIASQEKQNQLSSSITQEVGGSLPTSQLSESQPAANNPEQILGELAEIDATWNLYTNHQLGFSVKVPKQSWSLTAECQQITNNGKNFFTVKPNQIPTIVVTDTNGVYLTPKYQATLTSDNSCQSLDFNLANLATARRTWHIIAQSVNSQEELNLFIKQNFGSGCQLGQMKPSQQSGIYDVQVTGDGKDLSETACPLNYLYILKYAPSQLRAYTWDLGQAVTFTDQKGKNFDQEMVNSFKVI